MRNIPVWGKIALGLAVSALITLAIAAVGSLGIRTTGDALAETVQRRMPVQRQLAGLRHSLTAIQRVERTLLIPETMENPAQLARQKSNLTKYWAQAEAAIAAYETLLPQETADRAQSAAAAPVGQADGQNATQTEAAAPGAAWREVGDSVGRMSGISGQTSVAMDESARAVAELADQARRLGGIVEQIRQDADGGAAGEERLEVVAAAA